MILILTSSPCLEDSPLINPANRFIEELHRVVPRKAKALFVSAAPDDAGFSDWCAGSMAGSLETAGLTFDRVTSLDARTAFDAKQLVQESDFIIMEGGHVPTQNAFLHAIRLRRLIKSFDGVIMGISAGSMNCAEIVYSLPEEPGESIDPNYKRFLRGLGLTNTNILPHYQKVCNDILDGQRLYEDIAFGDSHGQKFYVFIDGSYLIRENNCEIIRGETRLIQNGQMRLICRAEEEFLLS